MIFKLKTWPFIWIAIQILAVFCCAQEDDFSNNFDVEELEKSIFEYKPNPNRIKLKSILNDSVIQNFYRGQPISIRVPSGEKIISSVLISKAESYKSTPLTVRPRTAAVGRDVIVAMSNDLIERLDYQPVRLVIYQSNIDRVVLASSEEEEGHPSISTQPVNTEFFVRLRPKNGVEVGFKQKQGFHIENEIINTDFPFREIQGIFFNSETPGMASVVLKNGDTVSGQHRWIGSIEFQTKWGDESIPLDQIVSITRSKTERLIPSGSDSPRYIIESNQ